MSQKIFKPDPILNSLRATLFEKNLSLKLAS